MKILHIYTGKVLFEIDEANLSGADLREANLREADLRGANLWGCAGERQKIKSIFISNIYPITYTSEILQIGCEGHLISDWWKFDDNKIKAMDGEKALKFWSSNKDLIKQIIEHSPAV